MVCEHKYMNIRPPPIIELAVPLGIIIFRQKFSHIDDSEYSVSDDLTFLPNCNPGNLYNFLRNSGKSF
jgi:hypothetical protein